MLCLLLLLTPIRLLGFADLKEHQFKDCHCLIVARCTMCLDGVLLTCLAVQLHSKRDMLIKKLALTGKHSCERLERLDFKS